MNDHIDPILFRGLTERRASRRDVLRLAGVGAGAIGGSAVLASCGVKGQKVKASDSTDTVKAFWAKQKKTGTVNFGNWPLYMDVSPKNKSDHPTLDAFKKETGSTVNYFEVIQSDSDFFAKLRPSLEAGKYCGYDMGIVQNDQYFSQYLELGYLVPLDQSRMKNFYANAGSQFTKRGYDKGNQYSMPWQAGFTGIGYNPKYTGREITSWQDLADPKFAGKVGMLGNTVDLPNCALLAIGVDPQKSTVDDWKKAADWIRKIKPKLRKFYDQDYISALAKGDIWITMAYSGDVFQQNLSGSNLKFVLPKEKAIFWIDNMIMFKGAKNPVDAMELMDFYYKPRQSADLTEYVNYICPVPAAKGLISKDAKTAPVKSDKKYLDALVDSYAVFPTKAEYAKSALGHIPTSKELSKWNQIFEPVFQG